MRTYSCSILSASASTALQSTAAWAATRSPAAGAPIRAIRTHAASGLTSILRWMLLDGCFFVLRRRVCAIVRDRKRGRDPGERRADQAAADVRGEALPCSPQVNGVNPGQVVPPEIELGNSEEPGEERAVSEPLQVVRREVTKHDRQHDQAGDLEHPDQLAAADDHDGEEGDDHASGQAAVLLDLDDLHR